MGYIQILTRAFWLTLRKPSLWVFGLFLSSGFNFHVWFGLDWLKTQQSVVEFLNFLGSIQLWKFALISGAATIILLAVVNFFKLLFITKIHDQLHTKEICKLCRADQNLSSLQVVLSQKKVLLRSVTVSLITIAISMSVIVFFTSYFVDVGISFVSHFVLAVSLLVVLVGISLWNLFTVLFLFWYRLPFLKSTILAAELLARNLKKVSAFSFLTTLFFLAALFGFSVIFVWLPSIFTQSLNWLPDINNMQIVSSGLLFFCILVCNVWFNTALILFFDYLVRGILDEQKERVVSPALRQAHMHSHFTRQ